MKDLTPRYSEGVDIPRAQAEEVWEFLIKFGQNQLQNTAFTEDKHFGPEDIKAIKKYFQGVLNFQESKFGSKGAVFNQSLTEHLLLAERIGNYVSGKLGIEQQLFSGLILVHDFGRLFSHRRGRNNVISTALEKKIGLRRELMELLPEDSLWTELDHESVIKRVKNMTSKNLGVKAAIELVDVMAKWEDRANGKLRRWEHIIPSSNSRQKKPDESINEPTMYASELVRQRKITSENGVAAVATKYTLIKDWFEEITHQGLDSLIEQIEEDLRIHPLAPDWKS